MANDPPTAAQPAALTPAPTPPLDALGGHPAVTAMAAAMGSGKRIAASGVAGSSTTLVAAAVARLTSRPVVLVLAHADEADEAAEELASLAVPAALLPALENLPGESGVSLDLFAQRLAAVRAVSGGLGSRVGGSGALRTPPVTRSTHVHPAGGGGEGNGSEGSAADALVLVCPIQALMQPVPSPARLGELMRVVAEGEPTPLADLVRWLDSAGYARLDAVEEPGDFALRGDILDVFPPAAGAGGAAPVRIEFFGDTVERISEFDPDTMGSDRRVGRVELTCADLSAVRDDAPGVEGSEPDRPGDRPDPGLSHQGRSVNFLDLLPAETLAIIAETGEVVEQGRGYFERVSDARGVWGPPAVMRLLAERCRGIAEVNQFSAPAAGDVRVGLPLSPLPAFHREASEGVKELVALAATHRVVVACQTGADLQRLQELLHEFAPGAGDVLEPIVAYVHRGFVLEGGSDGETGTPRPSSFIPRRSSPPSLCLVPYHELLHRYQTRRPRTRLRAARAMDTFLDIQPGDFVVHAEHGVAKFTGLRVMGRRGVKRFESPGEAPDLEQEYLTLEFAGRARLHVPATQIDLVQKYVGGFKGRPPLSTLGGQRWKAQKERVAESVKDLAAELLRVRAARSALPGIRFPADTPWQKEFEAQFPYEETEDQIAALAAIKRDMQDEKPMDRLICGDVGFGKTELAIRAVFKCVEFGKQAAVLVPTTVLAEQHERTFRSRFAGFPFRVESISRFKTDKQANDTLAALRRGEVDIIIGTHRLLSKDVKFADLGLVVVDEEQRFGVEHKDQLLRLRLAADVLTLSATPIPRTLHMSLLGLRDISSLATAPADRQSVVTEVIPWNERRLAQAVARELAREGQVFFVHNRVFNIRSAADEVQKLAPDARIVVGHGQMPARELEEVMLRFMRRDADILVSTTIIESGIDIPTANTMVIADADRFGLADLHQLRGRVGRYKHRAYCYLLLPKNRPLREVAKRRLDAVEHFNMLGAGFKIAMRDLEIRGAGNLLGPEQSGHIAAVGYEMYCRLLEDAVKHLSSEPVRQVSATGVEIGATGIIPKAYIPSDQRRMEAYRRLAQAASAEELSRLREDLAGAYGAPPAPVRRLIDLAEVRIAAAALGVRSLTVRKPDVVFRVASPDALVEHLNRSGGPGTVVALPPKSNEQLCEVYFRPPEAYLEPDSLIAVLRRRLGAPGPGGPIPGPALTPHRPRRSNTGRG